MHFVFIAMHKFISFLCVISLHLIFYDDHLRHETKNKYQL